MKIDIIKTEKGQIEYSVTGNGKPIVFLHGGHSNCHETLFHKGFDLSAYQLITLSRPGYGNTPLNGNTSPQKTADLLVCLLDYLKIDKAIVYAISAGGLSAIAFATTYPERVEKIIFASAVSKQWLDKNGKIYKMAKKMFNPKTEKLVWEAIRLFSGILPRMIANSFHPQFSSKKIKRLEKADVKELFSIFKHYNSKQGFMADIDHEINQSKIAEISCPALIVHSQNDTSVSFDHAQHAHKMIKNSQLIGLDNTWGHLFWIGKDADEAIENIMEFIEQ